MAKEIKAIKCPHCGSPRKTEIKPDHYRCESCQTEYFLDSDDVRVYHTHTHHNAPGSTPQMTPQVRKMVLYSTVGSFVIIFLFVFIGIKQSRNSASGYSAGEAATKREVTYSTWSSSTLPVTGAGNTPLMLVTGSRMYMGATGADAKNGVYVGFYDPLKKEEVKAQKLDIATASTSTDVKLRRFTNGEIYAIIEKSKVYKIDPVNMTTTDVSTTLYKDQPALQQGIATVEFMYENYGDGLTLLTNDGKSYFFYPLVNKLYTKDEVYEAERGFKNLLPGASDKVYHTFSGSSSDFPDEKIQLLRIVYKDNAGGPRDLLTRPYWSKDYQVPSGIYSGNIPYKKVLISERNKQNGRVVSYTDLTPDRLYFSPKVMFSDKNDLLITFRANAAPESALSLQCMNPDNGAIKWTVPLDNKKTIDEIARCKDGFLATTYREATMFGNDGKKISQYEIK